MTLEASSITLIHQSNYDYHRPWSQSPNQRRPPTPAPPTFTNPSPEFTPSPSAPKFSPRPPTPSPNSDPPPAPNSAHALHQPPAPTSAQAPPTSSLPLDELQEPRRREPKAGSGGQPTPLDSSRTRYSTTHQNARGPAISIRRGQRYCHHKTYRPHTTHTLTLLPLACHNSITFLFSVNIYHINHQLPHSYEHHHHTPPTQLPLQPPNYHT
nr:proline-rich receptor-like protein kinase PERK2 [Penaeus vannamei]